jgi:hypothetical protein
MIPGVIPNQVMTKQTFFQTEPFFYGSSFYGSGSIFSAKNSHL